MEIEQQPNTIGLDISERSLKAIQFTSYWGKKIKLKAISDLALEKGIIVDGEIIIKDQFVRAVDQLLSHPKIGKFGTQYVVACLPETKTFIKMIDIPLMTKEEMPQAIKWEAEHHIPLSIDETYWDWQVVDTKLKSQRIPILLGVAPKNIINSYTESLTQAKLITLALEIEAVPIVRSLIDKDIPPSTEATMIIDFGASHTSLCVVDKNTIQFTVSVPISGYQMTEIIAKKLNFSEDEAEKAKIICGLDSKKCEGAMREILYKVIDDLIKRIKETFIFYSEHFPNGDPIKKIILCGGGSNFKFIDSYITDIIKIKVELGNPWCNLKKVTPPYKPSALLSYTTAIGLALRAFENDYDKA
ncbi:MAG: type IV pilus assembly protein PilM [Patescibacteria group bacterium]